MLTLNRNRARVKKIIELLNLKVEVVASPPPAPPAARMLDYSKAENSQYKVTGL